MKIGNPKSLQRKIIENILVGILYYLTGRVGLLLAIPPGVATLVWPPSGIALAAVLLCGFHVWPAIALGSMSLNFPILFPYANLQAVINTSLISFGSTSQALAGGYLISLVVRNHFFSRVKTVFSFFLIEAYVCLIAPTFAVSSLILTQVILADQFFDAWLTWWLGDFTGVIVLTPLILAWAKPFKFKRIQLTFILEIVSFAFLFFLASILVFRYVTLPYPFLPFIIWAAFRFGQKGVTATILMIAAMCIAGHINDWSLFASNRDSIFQFYPFISVFAASGFFLAAALSEQNRAQRELEINQKNLIDSLNSVRDSEARLKLAIKAGRMGTWEWNIKKDKVIWSAELGQIYQISPDSFPVNFEAFKAFVHPDDVDMLITNVHQSLTRKDENAFFEYRIIKVDRSVAWLEARGSLILDSEGQPERMLGLCIDITERKRAEETHLYFEALVESTEDAVLGKTLNGTITSWNKAAERMFGYRQEEIVGQSILKLCPADKFDEEKSIIAKLTKGESVQHLETVRVTKQGNLFFVSLTISPIKDPSGKVIGISSVCRNITDRKLAEKALLMSHAELERKVVERTQELINVNRALKTEMEERFKAQREILEVREKEQKRIGQDLHDGLAQKLAGLSFIAKTVQQKLEKKLIQEAEDMTIILNHIRMAIDETKTLARGFYPIELERLGLFSALKELAINTEKLFKVSCVCKFDAAVSIANEEAATNVYRIVQETIHNSVRHGKAKKIYISIKKVDNTIVVLISDDGTGLSTNVKVGMGFRTMQHRAKLLGGNLEIANNDPGPGAFVSLKFPFTLDLNEEFNQLNNKPVEVL